MYSWWSEIALHSQIAPLLPLSPSVAPQNDPNVRAIVPQLSDTESG